MILCFYTSKKHAFLEGMISLLKSLCRKHDEFHHFGNFIAPKHVDNRDSSNTYLASINFAAIETVDILINPDNYKSGNWKPNFEGRRYMSSCFVSVSDGGH